MERKTLSPLFSLTETEWLQGRLSLEFDHCVVLHFYFLNSKTLTDVRSVSFPTLGTVDSDRGELGGSLPSRCSLSGVGRYRHIP